MRRWAPAAIAAPLGAAVIAAVVLALRSDEPAGPAPARPLRVTTSLSPQPAFFGDLVTARAEVLVDRRRVDPARVELQAEFAPYALVGALRRTRSDGRRITSLDYRFTLSCLTEDCLPRAGGLSLPQLRARAPLRAGGSTSVSTAWQRLDVTPRVDDAAETASPVPWRLELGLPGVSYRVSPGLLVAVLLLAAALLAAGGLALAALEVARYRRLRRERAWAVTQLARALELARQSAGRAADDRRRALALLARVLALEGNGDRRLVHDAARLAWGRRDPSQAGVEALVGDVERTVGRT
jgi:hypothetical protein